MRYFICYIMKIQFYTNIISNHIILLGTFFIWCRITNRISAEHMFKFDALHGKWRHLHMNDINKMYKSWGIPRDLTWLELSPAPHGLSVMWMQTFFPMQYKTKTYVNVEYMEMSKSRTFNSWSLRALTDVCWHIHAFITNWCEERFQKLLQA